MTLAVFVPAFSFFLGASAAAAQQVIDRRSAPLPSRTVVIDESCTVFGDGSQGRPEGLLDVASASIMRDSSVLILNAGTSELLRFGPTGRYLGAHGRAGEGPGEFSPAKGRRYRGLRSVPYRGDSLAIFDARFARVTIVDSQGLRARSFEVQGLPVVTRAFINGSTAGGDLILVAMGFVTEPRPRSGAYVRQDSVQVVRLNAAGEVKWVSPRMPDTMLDVVILSSSSVPVDRGQRHTMTGTQGMTYTSMHYTSVVETNNVVHHYAETSSEIHSFDSEGTLVRRLLLPKVPVALPPLPGTGNLRQSLSMMRDDVGRIWLEIPRAHREPTRDWWIIAAGGEIIATARMQGKVDPLWIGAQQVLLRALDSNGVETVRSCVLKSG
jgi:hypothetical protein